MQNSVSDLTTQITEYINCKADAYKLSLAERLTKLSSNIAGALVFGLLVSVALIALTFAAALFLSYLIGSLALSLIIIALLLLLIAIILYKLRHRLFNNSIIKLYIALIFEPHNEKNTNQ